MFDSWCSISSQLGDQGRQVRPKTAGQDFVRRRALCSCQANPVKLFEPEQWDSALVFVLFRRRNCPVHQGTPKHAVPMVMPRKPDFHPRDDSFC
jgi:hypothetical protein